MKLLQTCRFVAVIATVFSAILCCSGTLQADWVLVQNSPITIYRDTRTGLEWSVTLASVKHDHDYARQLVAQYGLRLPTWDELRDVVNNSGGINQLNIRKGYTDLYETSDPDVLAGAYGGSISTKRPRRPLLTQSWVLGVRRGSGNSQPPKNPSQGGGGGFRPGQIINPEYGDRITYINDIQIQDEEHFRQVIQNADTRINFTLIDQRTGNAYIFTTDLWPKGSTTRLGIYVKSDSRGGVMVTGIMDGTPGMRCRFVSNGNSQNNQPNVGKLYVLNVWGTNAEDLKYAGEHFMKMFEIEMNNSGLGPNPANIDTGITTDPVTNQRMDKVHFLAEYKTLSGAQATNENVLRACREISMKAQKNDVIFVYISCHGNTMNINGDNSKRYHILFPGITSRAEMDKAEYGVTRSAIIQALNPDAHRLTVLITDTCTKRQEQFGEGIKFAPVGGVKHPEITNLWLLLRTNKGFINWSSTSPFGGHDEDGELSLILPPSGPVDKDGIAVTAPYSVFDWAFSGYAFKENSKSEISESEFFEGLSDAQHKSFQEAKKKASRAALRSPMFTGQDTQTLFNFGKTGYVIDN